MSDQPTFDQAAIRRLLSDFLDGRDDWMVFVRRVNRLWQDLVSTDAEEGEWRSDSAVARSESGEPARDAAVGGRACERTVREILAGMDEDVQWYLGSHSAGEETDDAFFRDELRTVAEFWLARLDALGSKCPEKPSD